ncbi:MAG: hypothetical protein A2Y81_05835 [Nitrospirae bacterium RBG_13_43_8]|nr:MAG: hypothetical protein A2Y81_05835 [Nitrospirae bacterium RBG_13_43_8]
MVNICLIHTEQFHKDVILLLARKGVHVGYICTPPEQINHLVGSGSECVFHSVWDAMLGRPPASLSGEPRLSVPPEASLLERLFPYEPMTLQMLERLNYQNMRIQDLRRFYLKYVSYWRGVIDIIRPDAVVFQSVPHMGYDYVFYALCQIFGIRTLIVERTYLPDRLILIESIDRMPSPESKQNIKMEANGCLEYQTQSAENVLREELLDEIENRENYYDMHNRAFQLPGSSKFRLTKMLKTVVLPGRSLLGALVRRFSKLLKPTLTSIHGLTDPQPLLITYLWHLCKDSIYRISLMSVYESHVESPDFGSDYVYFPLQYQPERTSIPMGGVFADQLSALDILTHSLPPGWLVYVKEHPRQFTGVVPQSVRLARSKQFYKTLCKYDRRKVRLVSPSVSSDELIRNSKCVATLTGTTGWEAVQRGIPTIVFGVPWYIHCPGVHPVTSVDSCSKVIGEIAGGKTNVPRDQLESYVRWLNTKGTFQGYFADVFKSNLSAEENARSYAEAIATHLGV